MSLVEDQELRAPLSSWLSVVELAEDEVLLPGQRIQKGKLYASNVALQDAWLRSKGIECEVGACGDSFNALADTLGTMIKTADVLITSGGAWKGDHDLVIHVLDSLEADVIFHRVRMGPGKAVGMCILEGKPVFCLPGGPPSNEMAFLQLALPALMKMKGASPTVFPLVSAGLAAAVTGEKGWTEFIHARLAGKKDNLTVLPARLKSRLKSMAEKEALIIIPEDREEIPAGETVEVQLLKPMPDY